jgi:hypothetical protein
VRAASCSLSHGAGHGSRQFGAAAVQVKNDIPSYSELFFFFDAMRCDARIRTARSVVRTGVMLTFDVNHE